MSSRSLAAAAVLALSLVLVGTAGAEAPTNRSAPTISGSAAVGAQLTAHNGTWLYDNGLGCGSECEMSYQWERCNAAATSCAPIGGANGRFYTVHADDAGSRLRVIETMSIYDCGAHNTETGTIECRWDRRTVASAPTGAVPGSAPTTPTTPPAPAAPKPQAPLRPAATAAPKLTGVAMVDETLTASRGTWSGMQPLSLELQWQRCDAAGENCESLGITGDTYKVIRYDIGKTLRVAVTGANGAGALTAVSQPTDVVTELRPTEEKPWIAAAHVQAPHKLVIDQVSAAPQRLTRRGQVRVTLRVSDSRGFRVQGALVTAVALPARALVAPAEVQTDESGVVTLSFRVGPKLNVRKAGVLRFVITARRPGDRLTSPRAAIVRLQVPTGPGVAARR